MGILEVEGETPEECWPKLAQALSDQGTIRTDRIRRAFLACGRYLLADATDEEGRLLLASVDSAFAIGHGQTISQPTMVATMTELLAPQEGEIALDVGLGSGWQAMLLGCLVGEGGHVFGIERIHDLLLATRDRLAQLGIRNVHCIYGDALNAADVPEGPFDIITCAAGCENAPAFWKTQLRDNGRLVYPKQVAEVRDGIFYYGERVSDAGGAEDGPVHQLCLTRKSGSNFTEEFHGPLCLYVPLTPGKEE